MRAFDIAAAQPWAILPETLELILRIAAREVDVDAVERQLGRPLKNTRSVTYRDARDGRVAIVPVAGPIFRYANLFTEISGATSVQQLSADFNAALDDDAVDAVLLSIDSPGGTVGGVQEFAGMVYAARGRKPVWAWVDDLGTSAAYWIASAADRVEIAKTARVGSIGIVASWVDASEAERKAGRRTIEIVSSQSPNKRIDPDSDSGRATLQAEVDELADIFVADVARHRGVDTATVLERFGAGGVRIGTRAVRAGMADATGTFEKALARVARAAAKSASSRAASTPDTHTSAAPHPAAAPDSSTGDASTMMTAIRKLFGIAPREGESEEQAEARAEALLAAFPDDAEYARAQFELGHNVAAAVTCQVEALRADVDARGDEITRLGDENTRLTATVAERDDTITALRSQIDDMKKRPVVLTPKPDGAGEGAETDKTAEQLVDEYRGQGMGPTAAWKKVAREHPAEFAEYRERQAAAAHE